MAMGVEVILLSDNNNGGTYGATRPAAAYVLASQLKLAGISVKVIEYFTQHNDPLELIKPFLSSDIRLIGFCTTFISPTSSTKSHLVRCDSLYDFYKGELWFHKGEDLKKWLQSLRQEVEKFTLNCKFLIGGVKAQYAIWRKEFYNEIDYVCLGPGDIAIVDLVKGLRENQEPSCRTFNDVKILNNQADIDRKDCPRNMWGDDFHIQKNEALPLEVARGCLYNCKFCHHDKMESLRKTVQDLKDELTRNYELFGTNNYYLTDDCINDHRTKVEMFYEAVSSLNFKIEWVGFARVDVGIKFPHTMQMLMDTGARGLYFGLESFNQVAALKAGKGTPPEKVKEFLLSVHEKYSQDCLLAGSFIVGLPGETIDSQNATSEWLLNHPVLDFVNIGPLGLMPYVAQFDKLNIDYADYSRNPEKYGFKKVDFKTHYWEHDTFNYNTAYECAEKFKIDWNKLKRYQLFKSIWFYPHFRTLGFSRDQIFAMARDPLAYQNFSSNEIERRFKNLKSKYYNEMIGIMPKQSRSDGMAIHAELFN